MVGSQIKPDPESLERALSALDGVASLRSRLGGADAWLVGGAVRDLIRGEERADLDIVVEGDAAEAARRLGVPESLEDRFGTATTRLDGVRVDVAGARRETYEQPGALPTVAPCTLTEDLARRDFTVNAMALPLFGEAELIDPHGGLADLGDGILRVLHPGSFRDDPTRALRAARYAARLDFLVEPETLELLKATDLETVSGDRINAELRRILAEASGPEALELLASWGLAGIDSAAPSRLRATRELLADPDWAEIAEPADAGLAAAIPPDGSAATAERLAAACPARPSEGVGLVAGMRPHELVAGRVAGAEWLDQWVHEWRKVRLGIGGADLMGAGVPEGPAVGAGLKAALEAKLDGNTTGRADELRVALGAAQDASPLASEG